MKKRRLKKILGSLAQMEAEVIPLSEEVPLRHDLCNVVNVVSTNCIMDAGRNKEHQISLEALTRALPSSQYAPCNFAANILRLTDDTHHSAALIFRSGKINVVCSLSPQHGLYMSQLVRLLIEGIRYPMRDPETGRIIFASLEGRTKFTGWQANNVVGHSFLGMRIDLAALHLVAPDVTKYKPDSFPGLKWRLWTTDSRACECGFKKSKCQCTCRCLLFSSGKIVIVGARRVDHINRIFYRVKALIPEFEDYNEELPRSQRFAARFAKAMDTEGWAIPFPVEESDDSEEEEQEEEDEALAIELESRAVAYLSVNQRQEGTTRLMQACDNGNVDLVKKLFIMGMAGDVQARDADGLTALERIQDFENPAHQEICQILRAQQKSE